MSTKQKHLAPGGLALTRRTFLSSRYAKGSSALRMVSTVVVGFTFFIIMAAQSKENSINHFGSVHLQLQDK